jgi:hypothetical protein
MTDTSKISAPDLTQRPPRSPRCRLGGYVILPRVLDKGRATIIGKNGDFKYNASYDQHIINFLGFNPLALLEQLAAGKGDGKILEWINANAKYRPALWEIEQWSEYMIRRTPDSDPRLHVFLRRVGSFSKNARTSRRGWIFSISMTL